jgi:D-alanine-D-alanine ligase-like ATP-grasp enzyme
MKTIFVFYGGPSVEHNVSVNSAKAVLNALNRDKYHVQPVYITEEGVWLRLPEAKEAFENVEQMKRETDGQSIAQSLAAFLTSHDFSDGKTVFSLFCTVPTAKTAGFRVSLKPSMSPMSARV